MASPQERQKQLRRALVQEEETNQRLIEDRDRCHQALLDAKTHYKEVVGEVAIAREQEKIALEDYQRTLEAQSAQLGRVTQMRSQMAAAAGEITHGVGALVT